MKTRRPEYVTLGGLADFILPSLVAGASGMIVSGGNVAARSCVHVHDLWIRGQFSAALKAQRILSAGDWAHMRMGVRGTQLVLQQDFGYGGSPRRPLGVPGLEEVATKDTFEEIETLMKLDSELATSTEQDLYLYRTSLRHA